MIPWKDNAVHTLTTTPWHSEDDEVGVAASCETVRRALPAILPGDTAAFVSLTPSLDVCPKEWITKRKQSLADASDVQGAVCVAVEGTRFITLLHSVCFNPSAPTVYAVLPATTLVECLRLPADGISAVAILQAINDTRFATFQPGGELMPSNQDWVWSTCQSIGQASEALILCSSDVVVIKLPRPQATVPLTSRVRPPPPLSMHTGENDVRMLDAHPAAALAPKRKSDVAGIEVSCSI